MNPKKIEIFKPGDFEPDDHWYDKALNSTIHPMVNFFLNLSKDRIIKRYCHLHPRVQYDDLHNILSYECSYFKWAGADLINVTSAEGKRQMVVIENNSCPSGQKSMPLQDDHKEMGGYELLISRTFIPMLKKHKRKLPPGGLAVIYDKNPMEASAYAKVIAELTNEKVFFVSYYQNETDPSVHFDEGIMKVRDEKGAWHPIRACMRYLTQRPWNRLPLHSKTMIFNPVIACLAGGRNKMIAAKAYDYFNAELLGDKLKINTPETVWDVQKAEIPFIIKRMGGQGVVKIPYSNAGQGVFTIVSEEELNGFMAQDFQYERFIVQSLIGNYNWSSISKAGRLYHVGMIPDAKGNTYVADLRMMISSTPSGLRPIGIYGRKAAAPLLDTLSESSDSWEMLGTNLSIKKGEDQWGSDTSRLMLMDRRDFNKMGLSLDDLIEAFIQTVLSSIAIDKMCQNLYNKKGKFRKRLFTSLNDDASLLDEITL
jgi:hypothetical protein